MSETDSTDRQNFGEVFTRRWAVSVVLDLVDYTVDRDLGSLQLVEPACGTGAFLGPAVERLITSAKTHRRDWSTLENAIRAYDLQIEHVRSTRELCRKLLVAAGASARMAGLLAIQWVQHADFLLPVVEERQAHVVIGNPPYIRYDDIAEEIVMRYRESWQTMRGRGDIYIGFIERCLKMLAPNGVLGFICADRWMRNQYGSRLRDLIAEEYSVQHVWSIHDANAFHAQVSAYPAITVLANSQQGPVSVAETGEAFGETSAQALVKWSRDESGIVFDSDDVTAHRLPHWFEPGEPWPTGSPGKLALIEHLNDTFNPLHDPAGTGTKVSIGIATGADKVYVTKDPGIVERDRLLPLAMRHDLRSGSFQWQGSYLVNPWTADGSLVPLDQYPRLEHYLGMYPAVRLRHIARRNPGSWHRTIDKVHASLIDRPKLLLQDMKAYIDPVLENGGYYPHHNLYYIVSDSWDLEVLGGLLLSKIAQAFIEAYGIRMRGGTLRFQAQYLKRIRVPDPTTLSSANSNALRDAFRARDVMAATRAAEIAYEVNLADFNLALDG